jgi:hypothetical protein
MGSIMAAIGFAKLALAGFALVTIVLAAADRLWCVRDANGRLHASSPWRGAACRARESAHRLALRLWRDGRIVESPGRAALKAVANGIFFTVIWAGLLVLNYVVVAQILDIFLPSSDTIILPLVGEVGQAAAGAAPIIITLAMVAGILVHRVLLGVLTSRSRTQWVALAASLLFAGSLVAFEVLGSRVRYLITGQAVVMGGATPAESSYGLAVSMLIGLFVPIGEMFAGAFAWQGFLHSFIVSCFCRAQSLLLWVPCGWLYVIAGPRCITIHGSVGEIRARVERLEEAAAGAENKIAQCERAAGEAGGKLAGINATLDEFREAESHVEELEADAGHALAAVSQLETWVQGFQADSESAHRFTRARGLRMHDNGYIPLVLCLAEVTNSHCMLLEDQARKTEASVRAWVKAVSEGPIAKALAAAEEWMSAVSRYGCSTRDAAAEISGVEHRISDAGRELDGLRAQYAAIVEGAKEWVGAFDTAFRGPHPLEVDSRPDELTTGVPGSETAGTPDPGCPGHSNASHLPECSSGVDHKRRALQEEGFTDPRDLEASRDRMLALLAEIGDMSALFDQLRKRVDRTLAQLSALAQRLEDAGDAIPEQDWSGLVRRCKSCRSELQAKQQYLTGSDSICLVPVLQGLLEDWLEIVRAHGKDGTRIVRVAVADDEVPDKRQTSGKRGR